MPAWLAGHVAGGRVDIGGFLGSRLVYYPGSGIDGHPLRVFGASHSAHCFVFADNGLNRDDWIVPIREQGRRGVRGYRLLDVQDLSIDQLVPYGYRPGHPSLSLLDFDGKGSTSLRMISRCAPLCVLERMAGFHEGHGPRRLAILCLGGDAHQAYDILFRSPRRAPFAMLLQDHSWGGNWSRFGAGGVLEGLAKRADVLPDWMLCGGDVSMWAGYQRVPGLRGSVGGVHLQERQLWRRAGSSVVSRL